MALTVKVGFVFGFFKSSQHILITLMNKKSVIMREAGLPIFTLPSSQMSQSTD